MNYLKQKAAPWVSFSVLAGGMVAAVMLFFLAKIESDIQSLSAVADYEAYIEN